MDKAAHPTVSVIIPVFNRAQLVCRAIDSVLTQTYEDFELILVDDGSSDDLADSLSRITDLRFRLVSHDENKGVAAARNTGISQARGRYVAFLDSDDYWLSDKLERQLKFMSSSNGGVRLCCTAYKILSCYHPEEEYRYGKAILSEKDLQWGCRISPGSTLLAERSIFHDAGTFNEQMLRLEDWDWLLRCLRHTKLEILNEVLSVVDYSDIDRKIDYKDVRSSVDLMKHNYFITLGLLPSISRLRFLAALEYELAVAAYRNKRYGLATWYLFKSLCYMPYRSFNTFKRIGYRTVHDVLQSVPVQREKQPDKSDIRT